MPQKQKEALSSQSLIPIYQVKRGIVVLKNGSLRSILEVSGINLDLKSENEQTSILTSWRNLLNNLDYSLEVITCSRRVNISPYLNLLGERASQEQSELLKIQGEDYCNFIRNIVAENNIMRKKFYIVVPYDPIILKPGGIFNQLTGAFRGLLNINRQNLASVVLSEDEFNQYYQQLLIRRDTIISNLYRLGLPGRPLETKEIIELFFNYYNPESFERESLALPEEFNR